ncbi:hypothetical protein LR007_04435 [candidate division NPL-UPA2 bacterium]|nr:hypothetical protein [candidate division NPL-UPA2 bacterium]
MTFLLIVGLLIFGDGATYFFSLPSSKYRAWLRERRERWWMRMWPPAQWALDSEAKRYAIGIIQSLIGLLLIYLAF